MMPRQTVFHENDRSGLLMAQKPQCEYSSRTYFFNELLKSSTIHNNAVDNPTRNDLYIFILMSFVALNLASTRHPSCDRSKWPYGAVEKCKFGQRVLWHEVKFGGRHMDVEQLEPYRQIGDEPLDRILDLLERDGHPLRSGDDLLPIAEECYRSIGCKGNHGGGHLHNDDKHVETSPKRLSLETQESLASFYSYYYRLPSWANLDDILKGRRVLVSYFPAIVASLLYRSLVPGFSIPKIAAVLYETGYLAPPTKRERVRERLLDTGALIAVCARGGADHNSSDILGGGAAWKSAIQVRVLHAKVRRSLLRRRRSKSEHHRASWDVSSLGIPINQEDMAATLLAFSTNALLGCEMILGFALPLEERKAYMAFWRYIGWILGVPTVHDKGVHDGARPLDPCGEGWIDSKPNVMDHSHALLQSIIFHIMNPDQASVAMAHHLLRVGQQQDVQKSSDNWFYFRSLQCRRFVGHPLADALELPYHPRWHTRLFLWTVSTIYLLLLRVYTMASLPLSPIRSIIVDYHERNLTSYFARWQETHVARMKDRLMVLNEGTVCPFAMITPTDKHAAVSSVS